MVEARFDTYVNLMEEEELTRFRPYADIITYKCAQLKPPRADRLEFLHYPLVDGGVPLDGSSFLSFVFDVYLRLVSGRRLYVHCWGGHGRSGMVAAVILAIIQKNKSPDEAIKLCQELHAQRKYNPGHRSPEPTQIPFVREMIERVRQLPPNYTPPESFKLNHLSFTPYLPLDGASMVDVDGCVVSSSSDVDRRRRILSRLESRVRAGGGSGVIVVDPFGTASTTSALASHPTTPLRSHVRTIMADGDQPPEINLNSKGITRMMIPINEEHRIIGAPSASSSSSSSSALPRLASASAFPTPPPFTLIQMNTLADQLSDAASFPHVDPAILTWNHRKQLLLSELTDRHGGEVADIICIQECDHYDDWFKPQLAHHGYSQSTFLKKVSSFSADGVSLFVRDAAFTIARHESIVLEGMNQVLILAQLVPHDSNGVRMDHSDHRLYVATSHLKAKVGFELLRLRQVELITAHLLTFIHRHHPQSTLVTSPAAPSSNPPHASARAETHLPSHAAVIFAGDLNDIPGSQMYQFLTTGRVDRDGQSAHAATQPDSNLTLGAPRPSPLSLPMHSVYNRYFDPSHPLNHPGSLYTTVKYRDVLIERCIDYIFYAPQRLQPISLLTIPNINVQIPNYLPAEQYGSDHIAIKARFKWKETGQTH